MLSGKEKRYLRSLANTIDPVVQVGKASVNESKSAEKLSG